jgi:hypothetical protein
LTSLRPDVPPKLAALVARILAKRPAERGNALHLAEALAEFAEGHNLSELLTSHDVPLHDEQDSTMPRAPATVTIWPAPTPPEPAAPTPKKKPRRTVAYAVSAVVLVILLAVALRWLI